MKVGTKVRLKKKYVKWLSEHADNLFNYPTGIRSGKDRKRMKKLFANIGGYPTVQEQLADYFLNRYSYERNLTIDGVIVGDNGQKSPQDFAYAVWVVNELGEDFTFIEPKNLKKLK